MIRVFPSSAVLLCALFAALPALGQGFGFGKQKADLTNLGVIGARGEASGSSVNVREVLPQGSAAAAGLQVGDEIVGANGRAFTAGTPDAIHQLWREIDRSEASKKKNKPLTLNVRRGGGETELKLRIARLGPCAKSCPKKCKRCDKVVKQGLAFLAKTQAGNGAFPTTLGGKTGLVVVTSLGGLAFLAAGQSPQPGTPLGRAIEYVLKHANVKERGGMGGFGGAGGGNWNQENWEHAYALMFLAEAARKTRRGDLKNKVAELVAKLGQNQAASGGWAHGPGGPNALGYVELEIVSNYALLGMGAAKRLGIELEPEKVSRAMSWIVGTSKGDGGVGYSQRQGQKGHGDPGRTAGALVAFASLGHKSHPFFTKMSNFFLGRMGHLAEGHVSPAMHLLSGAMGAKVLGKKAWKAFMNTYRLQIMGARRPDGSFASTPTKESKSMRNNTDLTVGPRWTTATYVLILCLDRGKLPYLLGGKDTGSKKKKRKKKRVRTGSGK
jgi:hypothetical protein